MNRGFVVLAQNNADTDYISCALALALSIKRVMPDEKISIITNTPELVPANIFDKIIMLYEDKAIKDNWKLANDSQVYALSPYEFTIKLEADMFVPHDISWWFDVLQKHDLVICSTIRDHANKISTERYYRKFIDSANLPDTYNGITYFKKSELAETFYQTVSDVFTNWQIYQTELDLNHIQIAATDEVYAIASRIVDEDKVILPYFTEMSMIHMKPFIIKSDLEDWTEQFTYELTNFNFKIETIPQLYPVHYHVKSFAKELLREFNYE